MAKSVPIKDLSRYFRVPMRGIAVDYPGRDFLLKSRITNISLNGVFIETDAPFATDSKVDIAFRLPTSPRTIQASCIVRWSTVDTNRPSSAEGMGLEFIKIKKEDRRAIELYVMEFLTRIRS